MNQKLNFLYCFGEVKCLEFLIYQSGEILFGSFPWTILLPCHAAILAYLKQNKTGFKFKKSLLMLQ